VLALLLVGSATGATPDAPVLEDASAIGDPLARLRVEMGQTAVARARLIREMVEAPDDADLQSLYGEASAGNGNYADAFAGFTLGRAAGAYGVAALEAHADVLRVLGEPGEAVRVRTEILWADASAQRSLEAQLDLVDDYRADGDLGAAWDAAMLAVAVAPDRAAPYAQLAEVLMDLGEWTEAIQWLDVADLVGPRSSYLVRAEVRAAVHDGRHSEAKTRALMATQESRNDLELRALRAEAVTASGDAETGLWLVRMKRFEDIDHPQMLLAELHAVEALGRVDEARALRTRLRALYRRPLMNALGFMERP
jgi:tetratricopeptide (TPR) repeat protein